MDDRFTGRLVGVQRPSFAAGRSKFEYYDSMHSLPEGAAPNTKNTSFSITADVEIPEKGAPTGFEPVFQP